MLTLSSAVGSAVVMATAADLTPHPINHISIEFEIRPKFEVLWFKMYSAHHNEILHTSQQCNFRDVCKI